MATTTTVKCYSVYTFQIQDRFRKDTSFSLTLKVAFDVADLPLLIDRIEQVSEGRVCGVTVTTKYDVTGNKPNPEVGVYDSVTDLAKLSYDHIGSCSSTAQVIIPAPKFAMFTGTEKRLVDPNFASLIAFNNLLLDSNLVDRNTCAVDYVFDSGYRDNRPLSKPNVG